MEKQSRNQKMANRQTTMEKQRHESGMYYRIFNELDAIALSKGTMFHPLVKERIQELSAILDENYGRQRKITDMGGSILVFVTERDYLSLVDNILRFYHLEQSVREYEDIIGEKILDGIEWHEELWLMGSDDALVLIHPVEAGND